MTNNCVSKFAPLMTVVVAIIAIGSLCVLPAYVHESKGAQKSVTKKVIPFDSALDNTGCGGELVQVRGEVHFFNFVVLPDVGSSQTTTDIDFQVTESLGLKSGNKYQVTNMIINTQSADAGSGSLGVVENASVSFRLNGPDKGDDLLVRDFQITVNVTGQVTIDDSKVKIICGKQRIL